MANRNEAKIKFTAETAEFTQQIKNANSSLASFRAGLKLNEAEFKNTGNQAEYLKTKHTLLSYELQASREKQEALSGKLETAKAIYGENSVEVHNWETKLKNARAEEEQLKAQISDCEKEMVQQKTAAQEMQTPLNQLNSTINEQQSELEELKTEYKNIVLEQGKDSKSAQDLKSKIDSLNTELNDNEKKLRDVENAADDAGNEVEQSGKQAESSANGGWTVLKGTLSNLLSEGIHKAADGLKDFAKDTVQLGMGFESSLSNVEALSGALPGEMETLENSARELGRTTIFTASDVADGFSYMALAGWDTKEMLGGIDGVLNLAAAANMDLAEASDIVTDYLTAFGLTADDAGGFVDQMAFAMANSNTNVSQLGEAYKNCAATAASMGYSVEDTTAAIMTMSNAGVKGGEAGTGLSSIMTRLATNTKDCADKLSEYGVNVYDSQGNMNSLSSILNGCADIWDTLTDKEQANLAKTIAGTSQYSKFQTAMSGLSDAAKESGSSFNDYTKDLEGVRKASEDGKSAAEDMAGTMQDNLGGDLKTMESAFQDFQLSIYNDVDTPLRNVIQYVTGTIIPKLTDAYNWIKNTIVPAVSEAFNWLSEHKALLAIIAGVIATVTVALGLQAAVQGVKSAMNAAEATSLGALIAMKLADAAATMAALAPYILIVAAIAAVIAIIVVCVKHWDTIKETVTKVAKIVGDKIKEMWQGIKSVFSTIGNFIKNTWESIKTTTTIIITAIKTSISTVFNAIKNVITTVFNAVKTFIGNVWNAIKTVISTVVNTIKTVIFTVFNAVKNTISSIFNGIKNVAVTVWNGIKTAIFTPISKAKELVTSIVDGIRSKVSGTFDSVKITVSKVWNGIKTAITHPLETARDAVKAIIDKIKGFFSFKISWPHIPTPHFSVTPSGWKVGDLLKGSIPKLGISWYAKGAVFDSPTIFPTAYGLKGVGENGPEAVAPVSVLQRYVTDAVEKADVQDINYDLLANKVAHACSKMNISIDMDSRELGRVVRRYV